MKTRPLICYAALATASAVLAGSSLSSGPRDPISVPELPADPLAHEVALVEARRFTVGERITHTWRSDGLRYDSGWLLVLRADPGLIQPRQSREPVLYVGAQTANRVHSSARSGHVVAIVPGDFLLTDAPIFFGAPGLPEEIGPTHIDRELARAVAAGVAPPTAEEVAAAVIDPTVLGAADHYALRQQAVDLVARYSPQETDFLRGERAPRIR